MSGRNRTVACQNSGQKPTKLGCRQWPSSCTPECVLSSLIFNLRYSARSFTRRPGLALALLFTIALGVASIVTILGFVRGLTQPLSAPEPLNRVVPVFGQSAHRVMPVTGMMPETVAGVLRVRELLGLAAGGVFFVACVNVGVFLLGRAFTRFHETALRVALGARRGQLACELLADSIVISVAGGALGVLLTLWMSHLVPALLYEQDAEHLTLAPDVFGIAEASLVCVGITILCGLLPALGIPHERPIILLEADAAGSPPTMRRVRLGLGAAQMATCCVLVISTAFLLNGLRNALVTTEGQRLRHTIFATVEAKPSVAAEYFHRAEEAVKAIPGVSGIDWAGTLPGSLPMKQSFRVAPARPRLREVTLDIDWITASSLKLFSFPPKAGRFFGAAERSCRAALVNEEAAKELFGGYTAGRTLQGPESAQPIEIIGVLAMRGREKPARISRPTLYYDYTGHGHTPPRRVADARFRAAVTSELATAELETNVVSHGYFDAVGSRLIAGEGFTGHTKSAECRVGIVNREAADLYFTGNAIGGAVIDEQGRRTNIVGVVQPEPLGTFQRREGPALYLPMSQDVFTRMSMIVHVREVNRPLLAGLPRKLEAVPGRGPSPPLVRTIETYLNQTSLAPMRIATLILGVSAAMALVLSVLGLFGTLNDAARQRRRELGIRIALGAQRWRVAGQVLGEGVRLAGAGTVAGMLASLALSRWMSGITQGSSWPPLWVWLAAPIAMAAVVAVASVLPVRRALMVNPLIIMREDR
jgi:hypothetical protein